MISVDELKRREDQRQSTESELLQHFRPFVKEFQDHLKDFLEKARDAGVPEVGFHSATMTGTGTKEIEFTIRGMKLVALVPNRVRLLSVGGPPAAKIFVYAPDDEENIPFCEFSVAKKRGEYRWCLEWYAQESGRELRRRGALSEEDSGAQAANALLEFCYQLDFAWREELPLGAVLSEEPSRTVGFP